MEMMLCCSGSVFGFLAHGYGHCPAFATTCFTVTAVLLTSGRPECGTRPV